MSDFKATMHQIRFRLGLHPNPAGGAYSAPSDPHRKPTSKEEGDRKGGERGNGEGEDTIRRGHL